MQVNHRQEKLNTEGTRALNNIINQHVDLPLDTLVTISRVLVSDRMDHFKIFISCLPTDKQEKTITILEDNRKIIATQLFHQLRLKRMPDLVFKISESAATADSIMQTIDSL